MRPGQIAEAIRQLADDVGMHDADTADKLRALIPHLHRLDTAADPIPAAIERLARIVDQAGANAGRIAAAVERLAPPVPPSQPAPCVRCGGQGWLGNQAVSCPTCSGTGHRPT